MQSLAQEIKTFSKSKLRKQCTRVTTLSGRRIIETWKGSTVHVVEDTAQSETTCGYVQDNNWDLQVGVIKPYLLLGSQDAAHDFATLRKYKVSHILNVAYGVENAFPELFIYKTLSILDHPDTDITSYLHESSQFVDQANAEITMKCTTMQLISQRCCRIEDVTAAQLPISRTTPRQYILGTPADMRGLDWSKQYGTVVTKPITGQGVVLVHCNAGVSRAASVVIGYLMSKEGQPFDQAFATVKSARPATCPNPGFLDQLKSFKGVLQANGLAHA